MAAGTVTTGEAVTGGGIRSVKFFNGRLLTGEDLTREQEANALARLRIGRAVGSGVAHGLEVSVAPASANARPVVRVEAGLAVNREGRPLALTAATDVQFVRDRPDGSGTDALFKDCTPLQPGTYTAGAGVYLLTIAPATRNEGRARVSGLGNEDAACNVAFSVEGVEFRLWRLMLPTGVLSPAGRLRNRVAHLLFGTGDARRRTIENDPLGTPIGKYGLLDDLDCLDDSQVPLAVLNWTSAQGIRFVDLWSVRRRLVEPAADARFPTLVGDRRQAEAEAAFLQFQGEVADMLAAGTAMTTLLASDRFAFLPPVGIVPITGSGSAVGFDPATFLGAQGSTALETMDAAQLRPLVQESLAYDPIAVGGTERVQRYLIWENERDVRAGTVARRALVFARAALPYRGAARYGLARFGSSRFARSVT